MATFIMKCIVCGEGLELSQAVDGFDTVGGVHFACAETYRRIAKHAIDKLEGKVPSITLKDMQREEFEKREENRHLLERHRELLNDIEEEADPGQHIELLQIALCKKIEELELVKESSLRMLKP